MVLGPEHRLVKQCSLEKVARVVAQVKSTHQNKVEDVCAKGLQFV